MKALEESRMSASALESSSNEVYGALTESVHIAGYSIERSFSKLKWLLEDDRWKRVGPGFDDVYAFIATVKLDNLKLLMDERKDLAKMLKKIAPEVSNRDIAKVVKVGHSTVDRVIAPDGADKEKNEKKDSAEQKPSAPSGAPASLSGADAAKIVETKATQAAKSEQAKANNANVAAAPTVMPTGKSGTIVIDPPWPMEKIERDVRPNQVAFDYPTMEEGELNVFGATVNRAAADECHLFMWTTQKFLPMAMRLLDVWSFRYVLTMVWHKPGGFQPIGLPQYNCEFVLYARKGSPKFIDTKAFNCCFEAPRREHSRKPDEFYDLVRRVTAEGRLDIFSREPREGFAQFGNETEKFGEVA